MHIGWDWASEAHDVTVIDDASQIVDRWAPTHDEAGIVASLERLAGHGDPAELPIAIEATHSLVIDRLLAAGHPVVPIHPNAFHATRPRWGASKAKSDPGDSFKLADYLRTDGHRLRRLEPLTAETARAAGARAHPRRPCQRQGRRHQPARSAARTALARRHQHLRPSRQRHRPGLPRRLPHPGIGGPAR